MQPLFYFNIYMALRFHIFSDYGRPKEYQVAVAQANLE
jgi:hypothetical protein